MNLKGVFIGNGFTSYENDAERSMVDFGYGRGLIGEVLMKEFERNCPHLDFLYRNQPDVPESVSSKYFIDCVCIFIQNRRYCRSNFPYLCYNWIFNL